MENSDLLLTIAQIAIAFAGFASLAGVLGRQRSRDDPRFDAWRLRNILEAALSVVLFALVPFIPNALGLSEEATWRLSAVAFLLWSLTGTVLSGRRARSISRQGADTGSRAYLSLFLALELLIDIPLFLVCIGLFLQVASGLYVLALIMALVQAGLFFIRLVTSLLELGSD